MYLVHLREPYGTDTHTVLVSQAVWDWIHSAYQGNDEGLEPVPEAVRQELLAENRESDLTDGCLTIDDMDPVSDRATAAPGRTFTSLARAKQYIKVRGIPIAETYEGDLY